MARKFKWQQRQEVAAKQSTVKVKNNFDGATRGKRSGSSYTGVDNVNDSIDGDLETLRARSMGAYLNSPILSAAADQWVSDEIGSSATITPLSANSAFNTEITDLWKKHERFLDLDNQLNLVGILSVCTRERKISGEVFIRKIPQPAGAYPLPLKIQVIKSSMIPMLTRTRSNGNKIKQGIEYKNGRKVAVWFRKSEDDYEYYDLVRVPVRDLIHSFIQKLAGQRRGIPSMAPSLLKESEYNSYEENELNRKASQSAVVGMITRDEVFEGEVIEGEDSEVTETESTAPEFVKMGVNEILVGADGENLEMNNSPDVGQNYKDFTTNNQRLVSMGAGVPFQVVTGNYEGINDRTMRQINNNHRRKVKAERMLASEFLIVNKLWRWVVDASILSGLRVSDYWENRDDYRKCRFTAEAFAYDHAVQDLQSAERAIKLGVKSNQSFCEERGVDSGQNIQDKIEYIKEIKAQCETAGISYNEYMGNIDSDDSTT